MEVDEKPTEDYSDIGGLDKQIQELVEAIVLPVTHKASIWPAYMSNGQCIFSYAITAQVMQSSPCSFVCHAAAFTH